MNSKFIELWRLPAEVFEARDDALTLRYVLDQLEDPAAFMNKVTELYADPDAESFDTVHFKDHRVYERYSTPHRPRTPGHRHRNQWRRSTRRVATRRFWSSRTSRQCGGS